MKQTMTTFPQIDWHYHSIGLDELNSHCERGASSSFWRFSRDYFSSEAELHFVGEAIFFATIMVAAVIPLVSNALAVIQLCRTLAAS
jgi:hypothetical protein